MSNRKKEKFYVVWKGHQPGVYDTWIETAKQVSGYPSAHYKSFPSRQEAETAFSGRYWDYAGKDTTTVKKSLAELTDLGVCLDSVAVDAACSGSPGKIEYRVLTFALEPNSSMLDPTKTAPTTWGNFSRSFMRLRF